MLKKLNQLKIRDRLVRAFIMIACMLAAVSAVVLITMIVMSRLYASAIADYGFAQGDVGKAMAQFADTRSAMRGIIGYDDMSAVNTLLENHKTYKDNFTKDFENLEAYMITDENMKVYNDIKDRLDDYWKLEDEIITKGATVDIMQSRAAQDRAVNELIPVYNEIYDQLTQIMDIKVDEGQTVSNVLAIVIIILTVIIVIIIGISIAFAISLGKGIANSIAVPLDQIMQRLDIFAKGDLSSPFPTVDTQDELADMVTVTTNMAASLQFIIHDVAQVLHQMASANFAVISKDRSKYVGEFEGILTAMKLLKKQMAETLRSVGEASNQVSAGANNLSMASQSLAEGAADQAGAIEEMQATITTISDDIRVTAKNAEESYTQARTYADEAERSRREMKAMMGAMSRINEASQQVGNIISEIEAIASAERLH